MPDTIDTTPTLLIPRAPRPYKTCIVCGMLYRGDDCPFCNGVTKSWGKDLGRGKRR